MARGWESKSVESQQEEAARAKAPRSRPLTAEELADRSRRGTLMLARARAAADLAAAKTAAHREMLQRTLAAIDRELGTGGAGNVD